MINRNATEEHKKGPEQHRHFWVWAALATILLVTVVIRVRLLEAPLERDEGEYAYAGQLILQGIAPYAQVYNMKMPGIYAAYALILAVFGQTHSGIHFGLLVINAATIFLLFILANKLFGPVAGLVTAAAFALLSLGQWVQGIFANAEHFVILPALGGILLLRRAVDYQKWWSLLAGAFLLGLAPIMKQHGGAFIIFGGLYLLFCELRRRPFLWKLFVAKGILFLASVLLPFTLTCLALWWSGVFEKFWFWTFVYAREYISSLPLSKGLQYLKEYTVLIAGSSILIWLLAGIGLIPPLWNKKARRSWVFVLVFLLFSFLSMCPGFYFRPHYFILLLPAVALLAGIGACSVFDLLTRIIKKGPLTRIILMVSVLVVLVFTMHKQRDFLFVMSPAMASRTTYGYNPFPESLEIARYIKENSTKNDRIAVIGSEPQIYFYSNRRSATGHIYTYALMGKHSYALKMQQEMIRQIESARPKFLVFVNVDKSWLIRQKSENLIFEWFKQYQQEYYTPVGIIDIISEKQTIYRWGEEALQYSPRSKYWLVVLQRMSS